MNKFWLTFICLLSVTEVHGQSDNSPEGIIKEKLRRYCESVPREEIFIHTDRDEYIAGEDLWFNVYLFDRQKSVLTDHSSIAYFELINPDNRQITGKRIRLDKGLGPGHILLPDTLSTGRYIIRAYTNWMKNFLPYNCFVKEINVYNALSERILKGSPEPSCLIQGNTDNLKQPPEAVPGIEMKVDKAEAGRTKITLITDKSFRTTNMNKCYLLVQTHGIVNIVKKIDLISDSVIIYLIDEMLIPGVNQIVIFNTELDLLFEKLIYTPSTQTGNLNISTSDTFRTRERVSFMIRLAKDESDTLTAPRFSISAAPEAGKLSMPDIADYMVFGSEFGILPESVRNHNLSDVAADAINSFLMTAKSNWIDWSSVISGEIPELRYMSEKDSHYITGRLVDKNKQTPVKGANVLLSIPGKTATFQYSKTDSSGLFRFSLPLNHELLDLIIQPEDPGIESSIMIGSGFPEGYLRNSGNHETQLVPDQEYISKWSVNYQVRKIYGIKSTVDSLSPIIFSDKPGRFYGKPDIELNMNDYIKLPLMEEVFFELTPGVQLKRKRNTYFMTVADPVTNRIYEKPPVLLIDGVVINNPSVIAGLDPETVEKIDVVKDLYLVGDYMFFGIINVITTSGDFNGIALPENAVRLKYRVVEPVSSFTSPDYSSVDLKKSRIPDFRNTLYWNPSVRAVKEGITSIEFWTSDEKGSFEINLQGTNDKGKPVSFKKKITIN